MSKLPRVLVYVFGPFSPTASQKVKISAVDPTLKARFTRDAVEENIAHAGALALEVAKLGAFPMCPHLNTSLPEFEDVQPYDFWIDGTNEMLLRCDVAIGTDNYRESSGARGEAATCKDRNIPAFETIADLAAFLAEEGVEQFLATLRLARVLEWGVGLADRTSTIPSPAPDLETLPSIRSAVPTEADMQADVDSDFGEIDTSDFEPRSGALKL
jgi:hypothetical protein